MSPASDRPLIPPTSSPKEGSVSPSLQVAIRQDGGEPDSGFGLALAAALRWHDPNHGMAVALQGHTLLLHGASHLKEQGLALSFYWNPTPSTPLGPSFSISQHMGGPRSGNRNQLLQATTVRDITPLPQWVRSTTALHTHWPTASLPSDNPSPSHRRWALLSTPREAPTHGASPWHHCSRKTSPGTSSWKDTTNSTTLPLHDNAPFLSSSPSPSGPFQATPAHLPSRSFPRRRESMDQPVINKTPEPSGAGSRAVSPRMITSANSTPPGSRDAPTPLHSCTGTCSHRKRPLR